MNKLQTVLTVSILAVIFGLAPPKHACAGSSTLLLGEVLTGGMNNASQEFIELYNAAGIPINVSGWKVVYRSASGNTNLAVYPFGSDATVSSHDYFLLVHSGQTVGAEPDGAFSASLGSPGGGLAILDAIGTIVDSLGWGTATNSFVEGTAAAAPPAGSSLARTVMVDTDNNAADFLIAAVPTPGKPAGAVPLPAAFWLFGSAFVGLMGVRLLKN